MDLPVALTPLLPLCSNPPSDSNILIYSHMNSFVSLSWQRKIKVSIAKRFHNFGYFSSSNSELSWSLPHSQYVPFLKLIDIPHFYCLGGYGMSLLQVFRRWLGPCLHAIIELGLAQYFYISPFWTYILQYPSFLLINALTWSLHIETSQLLG